MVLQRLSVLLVVQFIFISCSGPGNDAPFQTQAFSQKKRSFATTTPGGDDGDDDDLIPAGVAIADQVCGLRSLTPPLDDQIPSEYLVIKTPAEFQNIRYDLNKKYVLGADIDFRGFAYQPIGYYKNFFDSSCFAGILDGNGYEIKNLVINQPDKMSVALFGCISGSIKNLRLRDLQVRGDSLVGALVGQLWGAIENVHLSRSVDFSGSIEANSRVGGLIGQMQGAATVNNSTADVVVSGGSNVGGLVGNMLYGPLGFVSGKISKSYTKAKVTGSSTDSSSLGGLLGSSMLGSIEDSCSESVVRGADAVGGLQGQMMSFDPSAGGGVTTAVISRSISKSNVSGRSRVGGLLGVLSANSLIENSYSISTVAVEQESAGGLVGYMGVSSSVADLAGIKNSFSITNLLVEPNATAIGGLVGQLVSVGSTNYSFVDASFVRRGDAVRPIGVTVGEGVIVGVGELTESDFRAPSVFQNVDWSEDIWKFEAGVFPKLLNEFR